MSIQEAINQLQSYTGPDKLILHPAANEALLMAVEETFGITLPNDFKEFYRFTDGFETEEDMFNIIPLAEVISNKKDDKQSPFYIAEYLMYSDMWWLDVNPNDNNDYKICVHSNGNTLILTNSLGEFIDHFLRGGVFEPGGLYYWHKEIEALPIYSTKLYTATILLTVFYYGLRYNFIQPKEVIEWADRLIMHENEPEHIFLDLSLGDDRNGLISILYPIIVPESGVVARAILGLLYHRLLAGSITVRDAVTVMDMYDFWGPLTKSEKQQLCYLPNDEWIKHTTNDDAELGEEVLEFLITYKEFKIANYNIGMALAIVLSFSLRETRKI